MAYLVSRWIHEAPEDEGQQDAGNTAPADDAGGGEEQLDQAGDTDDAGEDEENFDIDTSLDGDDEGDEEAVGGDDTGGGEDMSSDSSGGGGSEDDQGPIEANTDIFASLTAEEQQIKIQELKRLYRDLYLAVNDLIHRIDDIELTEDIMKVMTNVSDILHQLQDSIADYFQNMFNIRSYYENDVKYNEFLLVLKKTSTVVDDLAKSREKRAGDNSTNTPDENSNI